MTSLAAEHDCLLLDLDGTLFRGSQPTVGAIETLAAVNTRILYLTNNASRSPAEVAGHLQNLGFAAKPDDVVTSAQVAAHVLASELAADSPVLVVGTDALAAEVAAVGLRPVRQWSDAPVAVVQGFSRDTCWADLAEAALAIRDGALWIAANLDVTFPSELGLLPGNGAMVTALAVTTNRQPRVTGKPKATIFRDALDRGDFRAALVIGDRLDTDLEGANAAELPSLMVLTGVSTAEEAIFAPAHQRPTYLANDLRALTDSPDRLRVATQPGWNVALDSSKITVIAGDDTQADDGLSIIRAVAAAVWNRNDTIEPRPLAPGDDAAAAALRRAVAAGTLGSDSVNTL